MSVSRRAGGRERAVRVWFSFDDLCHQLATTTKEPAIWVRAQITMDDQILDRKAANGSVHVAPQDWYSAWEVINRTKIDTVTGRRLLALYHAYTEFLMQTPKLCGKPYFVPIIPTLGTPAL